MARKELRGTRYLTAANDPLARFIVNDLPYLDYEETCRWYAEIVPLVDNAGRALLGCNDRYFLLTGLCGRTDALHPWVFERCREVEASPDGHLDLWSRYHFKSSVGTFAGIIQEILCDPEITVGILSATQDLAEPFLVQIQQEFERNDVLKSVYPDVLWQNPRREADVWSRQSGIVVKRRGNPKEATVEAHGLIDGQPTGRHFRLLVFDDIVTQDLVGNPDRIKKVTERWELSDNLGTHQKTRKWHFGTRYCTTGDMRILMSDWTHKPIEDVQVGDVVVGWELRGGKRWLRQSKVINRGVHLKQSVNRYTFDHGRSVTCTDDHRWWRGPHGGGAEYAPLGLPEVTRPDRPPQGKRAVGKLTHIRELLVPLKPGDARDYGWLAGFFDGEGTIKKNKHHPSGIVSITQTMHNPGLIEETRSILNRLGFAFSESWIKPSEGPVAESKPKANQRNWADRCAFLINGGWSERYRFLAQVSPARREKLAATLFAQLTTTKRKLVSIDPVGQEDVHWLETETGNYVVEGFCSSNSYSDTYGVILERDILKPRIYPATVDGTLKGAPVLLSEERWQEVKNTQRSTVAAQMLLNPTAGIESTFLARWFRGYDVLPSIMNVYIMVDPSMGRTARSDRTAIAVIGIDGAGNKYLLDGVRHRMKLSERWQFIKQLYQKWVDHPGVQMVSVGYERYGQQVDLEVIDEYMTKEKIRFAIKELSFPREGPHSKTDRIRRLEPDLSKGRFWLPGVVWHPDYGNSDHRALWQVWTEEDVAKAEAEGKPNHAIDHIIYRPLQGPTRAQRAAGATFQKHRVVDAVMRRDEDGNAYDLTRVFMEEAMFHPHFNHDDLVDAVSRIYDMEPKPAVIYEDRAAEPVTYRDS